MEETTRYFVAASYPFDNADAWDCETKDRQRDYRVIEYFINRRQMFSIDELNDYENTLIAWDE